MVDRMRLEICCCNMYRYLQKTNGDPKTEGHMLLENSACVLISRNKVGRERREIYTHALFSRFTVYIYIIGRCFKETVYVLDTYMLFPC